MIKKLNNRGKNINLESLHIGKESLPPQDLLFVVSVEVLIVASLVCAEETADVSVALPDDVGALHGASLNLSGVCRSAAE